MTDKYRIKNDIPFNTSEQSQNRLNAIDKSLGTIGVTIQNLQINN